MSQQPYRPGAPIAVCRDFFIKSKSICADPQDSSPRNLTLCGRRRATGKGKGCVLSSAKISLLFRTVVIFDEKCFYFSISRTEKQKHGDFFSNCPLFLSSLSSFSFPSLLASHIRRRPPVGCSLAHDARGGTRTRALRTQQVSTFLPSPLTCNLLSNCSLGVKAFAFSLSSPEGEGASPKPSPTKRCCSIHCTHRVKR